MTCGGIKRLGKPPMTVDSWAKQQASFVCFHYRGRPYGVMEYKSWEDLEKHIATALSEAEVRGAARERERIKAMLESPSDVLINEPGWVHSYDVAIDVLLKEADESATRGFYANADVKRAIVATLRRVRAAIDTGEDGDAG